MSLNLSFPDSTYTASNKPVAATLKSDLSLIETDVNAIETDVNAHEADTTAHGIVSPATAIILYRTDYTGNGGVSYCGNQSASGTEIDISFITPLGGTLKSLYIKGDTSNTNGNIVFSIMKNGVITAVTATLGATVTSGNDTTHSASVSAGDTLSVKVDKSSASSGTIANCRIAFKIQLT